MLAIVCQANYCRSPVAKKLLQKYLPNHEIDSFGINYFPQANMDPRSKRFLESKNIIDLYHVPKKINNSHLKKIDLLLVMDMKVLNYFVVHHQNYLNKIKHFTYLDSKITIHDPYKFESYDDYFREMSKIEEMCKMWASYILDE